MSRFFHFPLIFPPPCSNSAKFSMTVIRTESEFWFYRMKTAFSMEYSLEDNRARRN